MSTVPFALRRPWLLLRDRFVDRDRPNLDALRALREPERFVWAILPHAARTFSACIAMLPAPQAKAAAVGYLYCRILDTYEDLSSSPAASRDALLAFGTRFAEDEDRPASPARGRGEGLAPAPALSAERARDLRDRSHLLLVERCSLVDAAYRSLPGRHRAAIRELVSSMAQGMAWASQVFEEQGGVLRDEDQLLRYCHHVMGNPVLFALRLEAGELTAAQQEDALRVGEFVQLANVTRDIEQDLLHGVAYAPLLQEHLGQDPGEDPALADKVHALRRTWCCLAWDRAPAFRRLVESLPFSFWSLGRASALLMLGFTDRHYRACAAKVGVPGWDGPRSTTGLLRQAVPAFFSRRWTSRVMGRVEEKLLTAVRAARSS